MSTINLSGIATKVTASKTIQVSAQKHINMAIDLVNRTVDGGRNLDSIARRELCEFSQSTALIGIAQHLDRIATSLEQNNE